MVNIYVGNLPYNTSESDLVTLFSTYGAVDRASIIMDRETGRSRGFGFVEMPNDEEGRQAIEALNGQDYNGRSLTINEARPRQARGDYGGGGGGGYSRSSDGDRDSGSTGYSGGYSNHITG